MPLFLPVRQPVLNTWIPSLRVLEISTPDPPGYFHSGLQNSSPPPHLALPVQTLGSLELLKLNLDSGSPGVITSAPSLCNARHRIPRTGHLCLTFWSLSPPLDSGMSPPPEPRNFKLGCPQQLAERETRLGSSPRVSTRPFAPPRVRNLILHAGLLRRGPRTQPPPRRALGRCTTRRNSCQGQSRAQVAPRPRHNPDATAS